MGLFSKLKDYNMELDEILDNQGKKVDMVIYFLM